MRYFFRTDRHYANRFQSMWLWQDWPGRGGSDTGIGIVAKEYDETMCAIQCKCYDENGNISLKQIAALLSATHARRFGPLVYTGSNIGRNAENMLQKNAGDIVTPEYIRSSTVNCGNCPKTGTEILKEIAHLSRTDRHRLH